MFECPKCNSEDIELVHVRNVHFGTCQKCKVAWLVGSKIFTVPEEIYQAADEQFQYLKNNFTCV